MQQNDVLRAVLELNSRFGLDYCYLIGSASILGSFPGIPDSLVIHTRDIDVIPDPVDPTQADAIRNQIDFVMGEGSDFDNDTGFFLQGVSFETPTYAPANWKERVKPLRYKGITAYCMGPHDLVLSKYGAGREKDRVFTAAIAKLNLLSRKQLLSLLDEIDCNDDARSRIRRMIQMDYESDG